MKTVIIKQEFLSSMLLEIIGERARLRERETEREWGQERERERLSRQRKKENPLKSPVIKYLCNN